MKNLNYILPVIFISLNLFSANVLSQTTTNTFPDNGNVGIGETDPDEKLEVIGNLKLEGDYYKFIQKRSNVYMEHLITGNGQGGGLMINSSYSGSGNPQNNSTYEIGPGNYGTHAGYLDFDGNARRWSFNVSDGAASLGQPVTFKELAYWDSNNGIAMSPSGNGQDFFMNTTGEIGVGTSSPLSTFHVYNGSNGSGSPHQFSGITLEDSDNAMISVLTPNNKNGYIGFSDSDDNYVGGMDYYHSSDKLILRANNHTVDIAIANDGSIGIGELNPVGDLQLEGVGQRLIFSTTTAQQEESARIEFWENHDGIENSSNAHFAIQYDGSGDRLRFKGKKSAAMPDYDILTMTRSGNVGIGVINPGQKLAVNGNIRSKEIKVELNNWPDYVFAPSYNLQSLSEVETFINQNGHLPNIPSAAEVEENNGIELGAMNAKLLEKIEELTLHLIEKDKQLKKQNCNIEELNFSKHKLEADLAQLEKKNSELETKLQMLISNIQSQEAKLNQIIDKNKNRNHQKSKNNQNQ